MPEIKNNKHLQGRKKISWFSSHVIPLHNWWVFNHSLIILISISANYSSPLLLEGHPGPHTNLNNGRHPRSRLREQDEVRGAVSRWVEHSRTEELKREGKNTGGCWKQGSSSKHRVRPGTPSHRTADRVSLLHLFMCSWQFWQWHLEWKAHYFAHMVERILCISWMHAVLHTHSVLSPGPAVLQTLANWETFCAVKIRREARLWLVRCDTSQKRQRNWKLRHVLLTHCNKRQLCKARTQSQHSPHSSSSCGFRPEHGLPFHTHRVPWGTSAWIQCCFHSWNAWRLYGKNGSEISQIYLGSG